MIVQFGKLLKKIFLKIIEKYVSNREIIDIP